ncbi:MAG TPA: Vms1/Ankzf1 family peptidyl-tRNA hydrolase [Solirubrobacteraceae bacterium]|nr:Vms1/Ankzf1 family peptidyl-tRNA hydrolase [Solirubrobacteraceae bacterium]
MNSIDAGPARRLIEHHTGHPVISFYLDLDPERFATAPPRAAQIRSLIDQAARELDEAAGALSHDDRIGLRRDLERIDDFLSSPTGRGEFQGAHALAVFCSGRDDLFEVVKLPRAVPGRVVIGRTPYVEPLVAALEERRWLVALVNRRLGRVLGGPVDRLEENGSFGDYVHGQHDQGGWSQARYERSIEKDVDDHLRRVADAVNQRWRSEAFHRAAVGGPVEIVPRLEGFLAAEVRAHLAPGRVEVDLSSAGDDEIRRALASLVLEDEKQLERDALDRLAAGIGSGGRAVGRPEDTIEALNERRVQTLLLEPGFDRRGARCLTCGLLMLEPHDRCPADGGDVEEVEHLREAAIEAALAQDAEVSFVRHYPDLGPLQGIGALLRF